MGLFALMCNCPVNFVDGTAAKGTRKTFDAPVMPVLLRKGLQGTNHAFVHHLVASEVHITEEVVEVGEMYETLQQ